MQHNYVNDKCKNCDLIRVPCFLYDGFTYRGKVSDTISQIFFSEPNCANRIMESVLL